MGLPQKLQIAGLDLFNNAPEPGAVNDGELHPAANVKRTFHAGLVAILVVFGSLGVWAGFAPLSGAVVATGTVKVDLNRKTIQHLEGGIVKEILVRDGDHVNAGQTLIVVEDERITATVEVLQGQLHAEGIKAARLLAERNESEAIDLPDRVLQNANDPQVAELIQSETSYYNSKRQTLKDQMRLLQQQQGEAQQEIGSLHDRMLAEVAASALLQEEIDANETIGKNQYVPKVHILGLKRQIEEYRARRGEHEANIAQTRQKITELNLRMVAIRNESVERAAQELTEVQAKIFDLEERLRPSEDAKRRQQILSPISGTVVDLKVYTIGGVIAPREALLDIVPDDNPLIIEAQIAVDAIDDVQLGQEADVRLSAYTRRSTPLVFGNVSYVAADRLLNEQTGEPFYTAHITITRESLAEAGNLAMFPGMPAEVFIRTGSRTALDYLLAPIEASMRRSFREP